MTEITGGQGFELLPEGHYVFRVREKPEKIKTAKSHRYKILFLVKEDENSRPRHYTQSFFPWDINPLLIAMGFEEDEGTKKIKWELDDLKNKVVEADIEHYPDGKDETITRTRMVRISEHIPF